MGSLDCQGFVAIDRPRRNMLEARHVLIRIKALGEQLRLNLRDPQPLRRETFVVSASNRDAVRLIDAWPAWPGGVLALVGPAGSGKTHLATAWAAQTGAGFVAHGDEPPDLQPLVLENAEQAAGDERLFHLLNRAALHGRSLLLTSRLRPADWSTPVADLRSRLNALPVAELGQLDDGVLRGVLIRLFAEQVITPAPELITYLAARIERSAPAAEAAVERLLRSASTLGRPINRALAQTLFSAAREDDEA